MTGDRGSPQLSQTTVLGFAGWCHTLARQHPRSSLTQVHLPRRTMGRASIHRVEVVTDMSLALSWRWKRSTSPLAAGWQAMVRILVEPRRHELLPQVRLKLAATVGGDGRGHTEVSNPASNEGVCHGCCHDVCQWDNVRPACKAIHISQYVGKTLAGWKWSEKSMCT